MLQSYQAILTDNSLNWIGDMPSQNNVEVIVTILSKPMQTQDKKRQAPLELKGMVTFSGDLINTDEIMQDWDILK